MISSDRKQNRATKLKERYSNALHKFDDDGAVSAPDVYVQKITMQEEAEQFAPLNHKGGQSTLQEQFHIQRAMKCELLCAAKSI